MGGSGLDDRMGTAGRAGTIRCQRALDLPLNDRYSKDRTQTCVRLFEIPCSIFDILNDACLGASSEPSIDQSLFTPGHTQQGNQGRRASPVGDRRLPFEDRVDFVFVAVVDGATVDHRRFDVGAVVQRCAVENQDVRVFAFFNAADPIFKTHHSGRLDGDRSQCGLFRATTT